MASILFALFFHNFSLALAEAAVPMITGATVLTGGAHGKHFFKFF
jgi:hypothetical protein